MALSDRIALGAVGRSCLNLDTPLIIERTQRTQHVLTSPILPYTLQSQTCLGLKPRYGTACGSCGVPLERQWNYDSVARRFVNMRCDVAHTRINANGNEHKSMLKVANKRTGCLDLRGCETRRNLPTTHGSQIR